MKKVLAIALCAMFLGATSLSAQCCTKDAGKKCDKTEQTDKKCCKDKKECSNKECCKDKKECTTKECCKDKKADSKKVEKK